MSQTIQISEKSAELLAQQAAAHGVSLETWIEELATQKAQAAGSHVESPSFLAPTEAGPAGRSLVEQMREFRSRVKPDPEGWTVKDYIDCGRR